MPKTATDVKFSRKGDELVALITGDIDHHGTTLIRHTIDREVQSEKPQSLILDLSGVNFMDSAGLGLILGRYNLATRLGIGFSVNSPSPSARRILSASGAERIIQVFDTTSKSTD